MRTHSLLNPVQRIIIIIAAGLMVALVLFPPWVSILDDGSRKIGFYYIFSVHIESQVDITLLIILFLAILFISFLLLIATSTPYNPQLFDDGEEFNRQLISSLESETAYDSALPQRRKSISQYSTKNLPAVIRDRAEIFIRNNQLSDATFLLQRFLKNWPKEIPIANADYLVLLYLLGHLYAHGEKLDEAEDLFQRIIEITEYVLGPVHTGLAVALEDYAVILEKMGFPTSAMQYKSLAVSIRTQAEQAAEPQLDPESLLKRAHQLDRIELPPLPLSIEIHFDPNKQLTASIPLQLGPVLPEQLVFHGGVNERVT